MPADQAGNARVLDRQHSGHKVPHGNAAQADDAIADLAIAAALRQQRRNHLGSGPGHGQAGELSAGEPRILQLHVSEMILDALQCENAKPTTAAFTLTIKASMPKSLLLLALVSLAIMGCEQSVADSTLPEDEKSRIDATVNQVLSSTKVPSASIAIVKNGRIAYLQAYGQARLTPPIEATPQMQYSVGSISKQFTAAAVLFLVQQRKLNLDDPVSKYLPELTRANEVTIRMLLSHTSGYQDYWPEDYVMTSMMVPTTAQHILDVWGKKPLDFDPGTEWQYSNTNYVIAGRIVEQVSGMPLIDPLKKRIFLPLGMDNVYDTDASKLPATDPTGYERHALGPPRPSPLEGARMDVCRWGARHARPRSGALGHQPDQSFAARRVFVRADVQAGPAQERRQHRLRPGRFLGIRDGHADIEHSGEVSGFVSAKRGIPQRSGRHNRAHQ